MNEQKQLPKINTPWGVSQTHTEMAEGICWVSTSSHGGYHLNEERWAQLQATFPFFSTYAGGAWYEEDQDWSVVVLRFPESFEDAMVFNAVRTVRGSLSMASEGRAHSPHAEEWAQVVAWLLQDEEGKKVMERAANYALSIEDKWERGSEGTSPRGWRVNFRRVRDGATRVVTVKDYSSKQFYTDAEIDEIDLDKLEEVPNTESCDHTTIDCECDEGDEGDEDTGRIFNEKGICVQQYTENGVIDHQARGLAQEADARAQRRAYNKAKKETEPYERSDAPDVDARGQCYSDADPGL